MSFVNVGDLTMGTWEADENTLQQRLWETEGNDPECFACVRFGMQKVLRPPRTKLQWIGKEDGRKLQKVLEQFPKIWNRLLNKILKILKKE